MKKVALLLLILNACSGAVAPHADACSASGDPAACEECIAHAPRGEAGYPICQSEGTGECCATTQADGSCTATFGDITEACAPVEMPACCSSVQCDVGYVSDTVTPSVTCSLALPCRDGNRICGELPQ